MKNYDLDPFLRQNDTTWLSTSAQEENEWVTAMDDMPSFEEHMASAGRESEFLGPAADVSSEEETESRDNSMEL